MKMAQFNFLWTLFSRMVSVLVMPRVTVQFTDNTTHTPMYYSGSNFNWMLHHVNT